MVKNDGTDGTDGRTSLISTAPEPAGVNCAEGGFRINELHDVPWREGLTVQDVLDHLKYTYILITVSIGEDVDRPFAGMGARGPTD